MLFVKFSLAQKAFLAGQCPISDCYFDHRCDHESQMIKICLIVPWSNLKDHRRFQHLTLFRMGIFWVAHGWGRRRAKSLPLLKIPVTHILQWWNVVQLYLTERRSKKYMNPVRDPQSSAGISIFYGKSTNFVTSRNTDTDGILIHNF